MRGLLIREPWIGKILEGEKTWELRRRNTHIRGRIALIRSRSGLIVGTADLVDSFPAPHRMLVRNRARHAVPMDLVRAYGSDLWVWHLADVRKLRTPVPYRHPSGAVIWVNGLPEL